LGDFDALTELNTPPERSRFWIVTLVMGYLHAQHLYKKPAVYLAIDAHQDTELAEFLTLVSSVLQEKMGISPEEADFAVKNCANDYYDRWNQQK
jgi:hypothetical protein